MRWLCALIQSLLARTQFERDMRDELRAHIEHRADDLVESGLSRAAALRQARLEFGAIESYKEQCRDEKGFAPWRIAHGFSGDLQLAARRLAATPLFTVFAVLSLAIGLGVTTAAYSIVAGIFFQSSSIEDEERVAFVVTGWGGKLLNGGISTPDFEDLRAAQKSFSSVAASATFFPAIASPSTTDLMRGEAVDGAYFSTLGVRPALGRLIDSKDVADAAPVVVLGHALWKLRFGSDVKVVGQTVGISGHPFEIIGVAPKEFEGLAHKLKGARVWIPLTADPRTPSTRVPERDRSRLTVIGRLARGATIESASAELTSIGASLDTAYPRSAIAKANGPHKRAWLARRVADVRDEDVILRRFGFVLIGLVSLVLVVACTNLANLVLARGTSRQQEFAVRRAIGASRWRLVREQCAESLIVAALGAGVAWMIFRALAVLLDVDLPIGGKLLISFAPTLDATVLAIASVALLGSLLVFGLEPALQLTRDHTLRRELASAAGSIGVPNPSRHRALVRWQVVISTSFFVVATMCVKYTIEQVRHDSGVDIDRIAVATMNFWAQQWDESRSRQTLARVLEEVEKDPGTESATMTTGVPFGATSTMSAWMTTTDKPFTPGGTFRSGPAIAATPRFFQTMGIAIVRGRGFDRRDIAAAHPVVVLSERTARGLFGTADVVGREMFVKDTSSPEPSARTVARAFALPTPQARTALVPGVRIATIIGVAANTDVIHLFSQDGDVLYLPIEQQTTGMPFGIAIVRAKEGPYEGLRIVREAIRRVDPDVAVESAGTGAGTLGGPTVLLRAASIFALSLGGLTLLLAMVGLYGVQSQGVSRRTREIGVRMSFGATAAQIRAMVLKDGSRPVLEGLAIGIFIGFVGRGIVRAYMWQKIGFVDPWMFVAVPIPLVLAALLACYWPARRASLVDPNVALRHL